MGLFSLPFTSDDRNCHIHEEFCEFMTIVSCFFLILPLFSAARSTLRAFYPGDKQNSHEMLFLNSCGGRASAGGRSLSPECLDERGRQLRSWPSPEPPAASTSFNSPLGKKGLCPVTRARLRARTATRASVTSRNETCVWQTGTSPGPAGGAGGGNRTSLGKVPLLGTHPG